MDTQALRELLLQLATNYRWTWRTSCRQLLMSLPGAHPTVHPRQTVMGLRTGHLDRLLGDDEFISEVRAEAVLLDELVGDGAPKIAYFSLEFGIDALVPQYAGGLGVLAGDHLKAASDFGVSLAGVGLFYRQGGFHQSIEDSHQVETFEDVNSHVVGALETGIVVEIPFPGRTVRARVLRMDVGRVPLILLNTDVADNSEEDRAITDRLYMGTERHRVDQEIVLGVGGARALAALGWDVELCHLNEGHAGFIALELIDQVIDNGKLEEAIDKVKQSLVFTTHTPIPAGIDRLHRETVTPDIDLWARRWGVGFSELWDLGSEPGDDDVFNMAALCLRMSRAANGVSRLHGEVSRGLFSDLEDGRRIGHVTNGVHARTWTADFAQNIFDEILGDGWAEGDPEAWMRVGKIDDEILRELRNQSSLPLAEMVASNGVFLDPDALTIGFARRFAPYKRANLILQDRGRLLEMLTDNDRPVHFLFAGKAHPSNQLAKTLISEVARFSESKESNARFTFIPGYNMRVGALMVQGCDIWLNNPIHPREASGTSGEKVVLNGGLNCSILDGWWAEMYDGVNGWAIASSQATDPELRDRTDASSAVDVLLKARDEFYEDRPAFNSRIRHAWRTLGPEVTAARMVRDYQAQMYLLTES